MNWIFGHDNINSSVFTTIWVVPLKTKSCLDLTEVGQIWFLAIFHITSCLSQVNANIFQNISTYTIYYLRTCVVYSNLICLHFIIQNSNLAIFSFSLFSQIIFIMGHFQQAHTTHSMYRFCCGIKPGKSARRAAF